MFARKFLPAAALTLLAATALPTAARADDYCREYTKTVYIDGRPREAYGTACRAPDGAWQIADGQSQADNTQPAPSPLDDVFNDEPEPRGNGLILADYAVPAVRYVEDPRVVYVIHDGPREIVRPRIEYVTYPRRIYYREPAPLFRLDVHWPHHHHDHDDHDRDHDRDHHDHDRD
jgi:hypothetical protein